MAIDTENKRRSVVLSEDGHTLPEPDSSIGAGDRAHVSFLYSGLNYKSGLGAILQGAFARKTTLVVSLTVPGDLVGSQEFLFSPKNGKPLNLQLGRDVRPYILSRGIQGRPTLIRPDKALTERARVTINFADDVAAFLPDFDSTVFTVTSGGSFWRRLKVAQPDLVGSRLEIKRGFVAAGFLLEDFETIFKGRVEDLDFQANGTVSVVAKDDLALTDRKIPSEVADTNEITSAIINPGDAVIGVSSGNDFTNPTVLDNKDLFPVVMRLNPGGASEEDVILSSITGNTIQVQENQVKQSEAFGTSPWVQSGSTTIVTEVNPGPFGGISTSDTITFALVGEKVDQNTSVVGTGITATFSIWLKAGGTASTGSTTMELVLSDGSESFSTCQSLTNKWKRFQISTTFTAGAAQTIFVRLKRGPSDPADFQAFGAQMETATSTRGFYASTGAVSGAGAGRGAFGTTDGTHNPGERVSEVVIYRQQTVDSGVHPVIILQDLVNRGSIKAVDVDQAAFDTEFDFIMGSQFKRSGVNTITEPIRVSELIKQVRESSLLDLWVSEEGLVKPRWSFRPNVPGEEVKDMTDAANLIASSASYRGNSEGRVTRANVFYNLKADAGGRRPSDFNNAQIFANLTTEQISGSKGRNIFSLWIFREQEAIEIAGRLVNRNLRGARIAQFSYDLKDDLSFELGDLITINTQDILIASGSSAIVGDVFWRITQKQDRREDGLVRAKAIEASTVRYAIIGEDSLPDFGAASDADKEFGYIGDSANLVGAPPELGYFIL